MWLTRFNRIVALLRKTWERPIQPIKKMPYKIYSSFDGTSNEMGWAVGQDHNPAPVHYWGGRVRAKRFGACYRAPDGGFAGSALVLALTHLPANSLVLGGSVNVITSVANLDGSTIRVYPTGNGSDDEIVWEATGTTGTGQNRDPKTVTGNSRDYFPGTLEWFLGTYDANASTGKRYWSFGPLGAGSQPAAGSTSQLHVYPLLWKTPTVWMAKLGLAGTMAADETVVIEGSLIYVND